MSDFNTDIWRLQAQLDIQGLIGALSHDDADIRKRAAAALRTLGAVESLPVLKQVLETEINPDTRSHILASIESLEEETEKRQTGRLQLKNETLSKDETLNHLIQQLKSDKPETVEEAAKKLADLQDKQAVEPLVVLFNDPTVAIKVRLAVAEALLKLESAPVEVALLGALRSNEWRVRRNGAAILGQLRADWAIEPLSKALRDDNELVRRTAYAALRYIGTPEAQQAVKDAVERAKKRKAKRTQQLKTLESASQPAESTPTSDETSKHDLPTESVESSTPTNDGKISWPKRDQEATELAPTKPLNPDILDEAKARYENLKNEQQPDDT